MQRLLTSATLVALLVATAAAFAITERLKLTKSALMPGTKVSKAFSPLAGGARARANVRIVLRRADTVSVAIVNSHRNGVATLAIDQPFRRGEAKFQWDGRTDGRTLAPDGSYRVRVHLANQHQTIVLPNVIRLDTKPPAFVGVTQNRDTFSPDGDHQADYLRISYVLTKPAHIALYLGGRRIVYTLRHPERGSVTWNGTAHGRVLRPGQYTLAVGAVDLAGNRMPIEDRARVHVRIRFIELASRRITVRSRRLFEIGVSTDAKRYHWKLGSRKGRNGGGVLRLRAPQRAGTYLLTVSANGHVDRARVRVHK